MPETVKVPLQLQSFKLLNPSVEHLVGELFDCRNTIDLLKSKGVNSPIIGFCENKLTAVEEALKPSFFKKIFTAWNLIHRVHEELILLLDKDELTALGNKLMHDIALTSFSEPVKSDWRGKIKALLDAKINDNNRGEAAQLFKTVLNLINDHVDNSFWEIWTKKFSAMIYTLMLVALMGVFYIMSSSCGVFSLCLSGILIIGAMGGLASGIISGDSQYMEKGHFWVSTIYYSLVRPTLGALTALIMFWMIQGQYLVKITPPLEDNNIASSCPKTPETSAFANHSSIMITGQQKDTLIVLNAA